MSARLARPLILLCAGAVLTACGGPASPPSALSATPTTQAAATETAEALDSFEVPAVPTGYVALPTGGTSSSFVWGMEDTGTSLPVSDHSRRITVTAACSGATGVALVLTAEGKPPVRKPFTCDQGIQTVVQVPAERGLSAMLHREGGDPEAKGGIAFTGDP